MSNLIRKYDIFNPSFLRDFFEDDFLTDSFFHKRLTPPINISENNNDYLIEVSIPGIEKDNISIKRQGNILTFSYEQQECKEIDKKNYHRKEFQSRSFSRSLNLPEDVKVDKIVSEYKNGVLTVSIPKLYQSKVKDEIIDIEVK